MRCRIGFQLLVIVFFATFGSLGRAESVTGAQRQAASDYLLAVSRNDPQVIAYAIHPAELDRLRFGVLQKLREESTRGGNAIRERLFGGAMPLADIERLTSVNFFRAVARRWSPTVRAHETLDGLSAPFISRIEGDPSGIIGLSLPLLRRVVNSLGLSWNSIAKSAVNA